jgi:hypothetical protein
LTLAHRFAANYPAFAAKEVDLNKFLPACVCTLACVLLLGQPNLLTAFATEPAKLTVEPSTIVLRGPRAAGQAVATLQTPDGRQIDVTRRALWTTTDSNVASVVDGRLQPAADGTCLITAALSDPQLGNLEAKLEVVVADQATSESLSFRRDVLPILNKYGCNSGSCHGKLAGQNGFRLSLFGFDPAADYNSLTKEGRGRRVFPAAPERSLLLEKAVADVPHGGSKRIDHDSAAYETLRTWIAAGAPWGDDDTSDHERIEVFPRDRGLTRNAAQQLRVVLHYADGASRDITAEAEFKSQRPEILDVDPRGLITTHDVSGEGTVLVRYLGIVQIARITVPFQDEVPENEYQHFQPANIVDQLTLAKWRELGVVPSHDSSDADFIRRAFLDAIGVLPTPQEVRDFLADPAADKRDRLVDQLLGRPEFVDYWALQLGDLLQNRKERDHDVRGVKNVRAFHQWIRQQVAANRPWDAIAHDVLTAKGDATSNPAIGYYVVTVGESGQPEQSEVVTSVAQAFLGTRLGCAKCHNHPLEKYTQDDYYHFAAFLSRVKLNRKEPKDGVTQLVISRQDANQNKDPVGVTQPRTGQFMKPQTLERQPIAIDAATDPREQLAAWIADSSNEYFAGAMVNRLVQHFFGVGLVEPVDDLRTTNPPSNQKLWDALCKEFVDHHFDLRHLMRVLMTSRTYQLSSATDAGNASDRQFYSHFIARRLPAEVLLDALSASTGAPDRFSGYPQGMRATQLPDPGLNSYFLSVFGRSPRTTACACERQGDVTLPQLLHLMNGDSVVQKIREPGGRLARLREQKATDEQMVEELFLATLSRLPDEQERQAVLAPVTADSSGEACVDLFWALLNSKEFSFNH